MYGLYCDQESFFSAVNDGDNKARSALKGSIGVGMLRKWMEECQVMIVSHPNPLFLCFVTIFDVD